MLMHLFAPFSSSQEKKSTSKLKSPQILRTSYRKSKIKMISFCQDIYSRSGTCRGTSFGRNIFRSLQRVQICQLTMINLMFQQNVLTSQKEKHLKSTPLFSSEMLSKLTLKWLYLRLIKKTKRRRLYSTQVTPSKTSIEFLMIRFKKLPVKIYAKSPVFKPKAAKNLYDQITAWESHHVMFQQLHLRTNFTTPV